MTKARVLTMLLLLPIFSIAQHKWEGGAFIGYTSYVGDLTVPSFTLRDSKLGFGLLIRNHINPVIGLRLNLLYGTLSGDDNHYRQYREREASFESPLFELSLVTEYSFLNSLNPENNTDIRNAIAPYIYAGVGFASTDPDVNYGKMKGMETDYPTTHFVIPAGAGIKFNLSEMSNFGVEFGGRFNFTDYLDGISKFANPGKNDFYFAGGVTMGFFLDKRN